MQNRSPFFSVIVPIFGVEKYLPQCINSILTQTFNDFELILVDDGSKDSCPKICDDFAKNDSRIRVIHKENGGVVSARQSGVEIAKGEYIACVDGDDWISSDYLSVFADAIKTTAADVLCSGAVWWTSESDNRIISFPLESGLYEKEKIEKEIFPWLIEDKNGRYFPNSLWSKVFALKIYKQQQKLINAIVQIGEDSACVKPCIYHANKLMILPDCNYYYRQIQSSMTKKKKAFDWDGPEIIAQHFEQTIPMNEVDFQQQVYRNCVHNLFNVVLSQFYQNKSYKQIRIDMIHEIERPYYKNAIRHAKFSFGTKGWFACMLLRNKFFFLIRILNRFR